MAMAFTAWFRAPAPTTWTSTAPVCRTTPAIAPATEFGFERLETLRISTGPPGWRGSVVVEKISTAPLTLPARRFVVFGWVCPPHAGRSKTRSVRGQKRRSVEADRLVVRVADVLGLGLRSIGRRGQARSLADALGDLDHDLEVVGQKGLGVLSALAQLLALIREPGARLLHQPEVDPDVDERALAADALAIRDVKLCLAERTCAVRD